MRRLLWIVLVAPVLPLVLALGTLAGLVILLSASVRPRADPARNANSADRYYARAMVLGGAVPGRTLVGAMRGLAIALVSTVGIAACVAERAGPPATPTVTIMFPSPIPATTPLPPLDLPRIARGQACPTTALQHLGATGAPADFGHGEFYTVPMAGPVYPIVYGIDRRTGVVPMSAFGTSIEPEYASYRWLKVRWIIAPGYTGPAVARGRQLDGDSPVRFEQPGLLRLEIGAENTASAGTWRYHTARGSISVDGPGCYGIQIDGEGWSTKLIFAVSP